ncbi:lipopolysaccharide biosynthesis protein [Chromobacterium haemolyticum]|uniref:lipopolysaccharide biosynthesis protein n=1 Tax=Chromobacterium haemolyticum TaxID=394935 RepID=UPI00113103FC|nr:lipopolysaccharide biosynthesis protein [Chromobacterium haemolyticum]
MSTWFDGFLPQALLARLLSPWVCIGLPLALCGGYFVLIAQDRYVSESKVIVKRAGDGGDDLKLSTLLGAGAPTVREDAMLLQQYIHSPDMLQRLERRLEFKQAYRAAGLDWPHRLSASASKEETLAFYRNKVGVLFDDKTSLLTIRSQGFTPQFAQGLNLAILQECERFINGLSQTISRNELAFAQQETERAYQALNAAKEALLRYQNSHGQLDPVAQAQAAGQLLAELQAKQAQLETELRNLQSYLQSDAPQITALTGALAALKAQILHEKSKLAAPEDGRLNRQAAQYQELKAKADFQADLYKLALTALEKSRVEASHKRKSLAVVSSPQLAEDAEYPRQFHTLATLLIVCSLLYGCARLALSIIEDHKI